MAKPAEGHDPGRRSKDRAVFIISVAAELAGVHPQTLRIYERKGLLQPARTAGNTRRYSERDIERLQTIQRLTQEEGLNLAGVKMFVEMEDEIDQLRRRMETMGRELRQVRVQMARELERIHREYGRGRRGDIVPASEVRAVRFPPAAPPPQSGRGPIPVGPVRPRHG
jgi:MerR family transcriptional regulator/heat shock protein HspR